MRANIAHKRITAIDSDAHRETPPCVVRQLIFCKCSQNRQACSASGDRMVAPAAWRAPECHDGITDELVNGTALALNGLRRKIQKGAYEWHHIVA